KTPLQLEQGPLIEIRNKSARVDMFDHARAPEGRRWHSDSACQTVAAIACLVLVGHRRNAGDDATLSPARFDAALLGECRNIAVEFTRLDLFHERKAIKGIARVGNLARRISGHTFILDKVTGQSGTPEENRNRYPLARKLLQVLPHDARRFDQKTR